MRIRVHPTQTITVTVPIALPFEQAREFVESKHAWIRKHLQKMQESQRNQPAQPQLSLNELNKARQELFSRFEQFSGEYKLPYRRVALRCQKTQWGSCSGQNNVSLNINIAFLPKHLQDYILLHELCHIRHKNHSKAFWTQLDKYCNGRAKQLAKELKAHPMKIRK